MSFFCVSEKCRNKEQEERKSGQLKRRKGWENTSFPNQFSRHCTCNYEEKWFGFGDPSNLFRFDSFLGNKKLLMNKNWLKYKGTHFAQWYVFLVSNKREHITFLRVLIDFTADMAKRWNSISPGWPRPFVLLPNKPRRSRSRHISSRSCWRGSRKKFQRRTWHRAPSSHRL